MNRTGVILGILLLCVAKTDAQMPYFPGAPAAVTDSVSHDVWRALKRFEDRFAVGDYLSIVGEVDMVYGAAYALDDALLGGPFAFRLDEIGKAYLRDFLARRADMTQTVSDSLGFFLMRIDSTFTRYDTLVVGQDTVISARDTTVIVGYKSEQVYFYLTGLDLEVVLNLVPPPELASRLPPSNVVGVRRLLPGEHARYTLTTAVEEYAMDERRWMAAQLQAMMSGHPLMRLVFLPDMIQVEGDHAHVETAYELRSLIEDQRRSGHIQLAFVLRDGQWLMRGVKTLIEQLWKDPSESGPAEKEVLPGDFNEDGTVDFADFILFATHYGQSNAQIDFDVRFDLDGDGRVDFADFLVFAAAFGG